MRTHCISVLSTIMSFARHMLLCVTGILSVLGVCHFAEHATPALSAQCNTPRLHCPHNVIRPNGMPSVTIYPILQRLSKSIVIVQRPIVVV